MFTRLLKSEAAQRSASRLLGAYLAFALRTTRWVIEGEEHLALFVCDRAVVVAFWHECLPLIPALLAQARRQNPGRRATMLVSRHRDGRFIAAALQSFGISTVHGSSARPERSDRDKGGAPGLRALLAVLAEGQAVAITPDGPRGPRRVAAGGTAQLAALSGAPILPVAACTSFRLYLRTWDRMVVPLPFGQGKLVCLAPIEVARDGQVASMPALAAALNAAADQAGIRL
jgi:lysophospholipid acyltransferase (LPLAT)-like uncharacterized protein